jgi:hypothetical protein
LASRCRTTEPSFGAGRCPARRTGKPPSPSDPTARVGDASYAVLSRRRRKVKEILVADAGGRCTVCGYDHHVGVLQFHHRDPAQKRFSLSEAGLARSLERAREEARKCVLLCANCHTELEAGLISIP